MLMVGGRLLYECKRKSLCVQNQILNMSKNSNGMCKQIKPNIIRNNK